MFRRVCTRLSRMLPARLARYVTGQLIGYAVVNAATFGLDLLLLTIMRDAMGWPVPVGITIGYAVALSLGFVLQRWLNFPSHAHVGPQAARYALTVGVNYAVLVLALGSGLAWAGVPLQLARILAACAEAVFLFCALRWFVFRGATTGDGARVR
ncbi:putative flippase GtrA [Pseudonocardia endophytica]|uniref:Putative flippase GtrA n=1 Tax=Pseudonocardia endophytica TaxID=401976 RepID=A0A4R1HHQ2_PSEEN|nr:putative flippase GtrA [Pseudonocardia endophytica]